MPAAFFGHGNPMNALETTATPRPGARSAGGAATAGDPGRLRALVHQRHRGHRDAAAAHHPRLLRLSRRAVRRAVPGAGAARARRRGHRRRAPDLGRRRRRQLGHRPRHLVGAGARLPGRRRPGGAAVHQRRQAVRLPPRSGREAGPAARARGADRRQRQRGAQPGRDDSALHDGGFDWAQRFDEEAKAQMLDDPTDTAARRPPRLPGRGAHPRPLHPAALPRRAGRGATAGRRRAGRRLRVRVAVDDRLHPGLECPPTSAPCGQPISSDQNRTVGAGGRGISGSTCPNSRSI